MGSEKLEPESSNAELKALTNNKEVDGKGSDEEDIGEISKEMEEEKRLQKAREQLHISQAKKREEEEATERSHENIRKRMEEQQKLKEAEELEAKQKEKEEAEKVKKAQKKQE